MRRYSSLVIAVGVAIGLGAAPAHVDASENCQRPHTRTLKANEQVRVYDKRTRYGDRDVYACLYRTGKQHYLGRSRDGPTYGEEVSPIRLHGALVAWKNSEWSISGGGYYLAVRNMRTEKTLRTYRQYGGQDGCYEDACYSWDAYGPVVDRNGSAAWIATGVNVVGDVRHNVFKSDASRHAELLDYGARIDADSLVRDARTISWRHGDETRTAVFAR
jgi:hypothetical protein